MDPLVFEPFLRPQVWGGRKLSDWNKRLPDDASYGESWEISGHPMHVSIVSEGAYAGKSINELWIDHSELFSGSPSPPSERFPLLFKFLEANVFLSVQVHPTDELARQIIGNESGKTEAWVILDVAPGAMVFAGLKPGIDAETFARHMDEGTVADCLHAFHPHVGDCIFLPAGTVHAVGGGVLFAEVQQTSDATFRLFDWNRPGTDGKPRQLHKTEGLQSIDWSQGPVDPVRTNSIELGDGNQVTNLVRCNYFEMTSYLIPDRLTVPATASFQVWMLLEGEAVLQREKSGYSRRFQRGETVLIPAACGETTWTLERKSKPCRLLHVTTSTP